jgi:hypothetical protein
MKGQWGWGQRCRPQPRGGRGNGTPIENDAGIELTTRHGKLSQNHRSRSSTSSAGEELFHRQKYDGVKFAHAPVQAATAAAQPRPIVSDLVKSSSALEGVGAEVEDGGTEAGGMDDGGTEAGAMEVGVTGRGWVFRPYRRFYSSWPCAYGYRYGYGCPYGYRWTYRWGCRLKMAFRNKTWEMRA